MGQHPADRDLAIGDLLPASLDEGVFLERLAEIEPFGGKAGGIVGPADQGSLGCPA
jgi:hypothetical protein